MEEDAFSGLISILPLSCYHAWRWFLGSRPVGSWTSCLYFEHPVFSNHSLGDTSETARCVAVSLVAVIPLVSICSYCIPFSMAWELGPFEYSYCLGVIHILLGHSILHGFSCSVAYHTAACPSRNDHRMESNANRTCRDALLSP